MQVIKSEDQQQVYSPTNITHLNFIFFQQAFESRIAALLKKAFVGVHVDHDTIFFVDELFEYGVRFVAMTLVTFDNCYRISLIVVERGSL